MDTPEILTLEQCAAYLQLTRQTVGKLVRAGKIPATRLGSEWRISKAKLDEKLFGPSKSKPHPAAA